VIRTHARECGDPAIKRHQRSHGIGAERGKNAGRDTDVMLMRIAQAGQPSFSAMSSARAMDGCGGWTKGPRRLT